MKLFTLRLAAGIAIVGLAIAAHANSGPLHEALMALHGR